MNDPQTYQARFVCVSCRRGDTDRASWLSTVLGVVLSVSKELPRSHEPVWDLDGRRCVRRNAPMFTVGSDLRLPTRNDRAGWELLSELLRSGDRLADCACHRPDSPPRTKAAMRALRVRACLSGRTAPAQLTAEHRSSTICG